MVSPQLDMSLKCIKYLLLAANALIALTAVLSISFGISFFIVYEDYRHIFDPDYFTPAATLVFAGTAMLGVSFLGWCGAIQESSCMVLSFAAVLSIILSLEIGGMITAFFMKDEMMDLVKVKINSTMYEYDHNREAAVALDAMQYSLKCCGYDGYEDWENIRTYVSGDITAPHSCCITFIWDAKDDSLFCNEVHKRGCLDPLEALVNHNSIKIGIGALLIAMLQLTGIIFSCTLGRAIRGQKTLREMRKWRYDEAIIAKGYGPVNTDEPYSRTSYLTPIKTISPEH